MGAKQKLEKMIKEIRRDSTTSNLQTWQNIWFGLDYDQKNNICSTEGWEYVTKFLELLSSEKLTLEGIGYIFEYILSIAGTSESRDYPAPIDFEISTICDILLEQKKNLHDQNREVRLDIINKGVRILDKMNNLQAIKTLVQFVKPNLAPGTYEIENRVTEFTLKSIETLIIYASKKFPHKQYKSRNSTELSPELRSLISETMLAGHINDNSSELIVYCNCSLDSRELNLEDFSENKKKRRDLLDSWIADEISSSEHTKSAELIPEDPECIVCGHHPDKAHICADCDALICESCAKAPEGELWNRQYALEIIPYLECEKTIASIIHFIDSEYTDEVSIVLQMMDDYWKPEYLDKVTNLAADLSFRDSQGGFRAYSRKAFEKIRFSASGFGIDAEILVNAANSGLRIVEEKVTVIYDTGGKTSTKNPISHTSEVVFSLIDLIAQRHPLRFLGMPGILLIILGIILTIHVLDVFNEIRYFSIPYTLGAFGSLVLGLILLLMSVILYSISSSTKNLR